MMEHQGTYNVMLVLLSIIIALMASYTTLSLISRVFVVKGRFRVWWVVGGSVAMGIGIWSMHFIGMLAYRMNTEVTYHSFMLLVSLLFAVGASLVSLLFATSMKKGGGYRILIGGVLMALPIVSMHYTGMSAMNMKVHIQYDWIWCTVSIVLPVIACVRVLYLAENFRKGLPAINRKRRLEGAVVLAAAIVGMHYTGMAAAQFDAYPHMTHKYEQLFIVKGEHLAWIIGANTCVIIGLVLSGLWLDRRAAQHAARLNEQRYHSIFEHNPDLVCSFDLKGQMLTANPSALQLTGYTAEELLSLSYFSLFEPESSAAALECFRQAASGHPQKAKLVLRHKEGRPVWMSVTIVPFMLDGTPVDIYIICKDITEAYNKQEQMYYMAHHDGLTELPNKRLLVERIGHSLAQGKRENRPIFLMFMDLDGFKQVNDQYGHQMGDLLLKAAAERIANCIREDDTLSRLGGDEFLLLLSTISEAAALEVADRIIDRFTDPVIINGHKIQVAISIGISSFSAGEYEVQDVEEMIKMSDKAMYEAKKNGKNQYYLLPR